MASVLEPQPASPPTARRSRSGRIVGALVVVASLAACGGGDDAAPATATTGTSEATASAAQGAPDARLAVKLDPQRVGSAERPQPVRIAVDLRMAPAVPGDQVPPVQAVELEIPPGVLFRPDELASCAPETLDADGPAGCPNASRIGSGTVSAHAGTVEVEGKATAVYGGDDRVLLWVEIANPVSVGAAISGALESQPGGGYLMALRVPAELQDVAGIPVSLSGLRVSLGRGGALATTGCPDSGLAFAARLALGDVTSEADAIATCR